MANQLQTRKRSPIPEGEAKNGEEVQQNSFKKKNEYDMTPAQLRSLSNNSNYQLPKVTTTLSPAKKSTMFKLPRIEQEEINLLESICFITKE